MIRISPELKDQRYIDELRKVLSTGKFVRNQDSRAIVNVGNTRNEFYIDNDYLPLKEEDGQVSGVIITVIDLTEKHRAKIQLLNFSKALEEKVPVRTQVFKKTNEQLTK